eukprot:665957-Amphidinium_carterae.1
MALWVRLRVAEWGIYDLCPRLFSWNWLPWNGLEFTESFAAILRSLHEPFHIPALGYKPFRGHDKVLQAVFHDPNICAVLPPGLQLGLSCHRATGMPRSLSTMGCCNGPTPPSVPSSPPAPI